MDLIQDQSIKISELEEKLKIVDSSRTEDLKKFQESLKQLEQKFTLDNEKQQHSIQQLDKIIKQDLNLTLPVKQDYQNNEKDQNENYINGKKLIGNMSILLQNMQKARNDQNILLIPKPILQPIPQPRPTPSLPSILLFSNCDRTQQFIMETLCKSKFNTYKKNQIKEINCNLFGTDPFDFQNIDSREQQIAELQKIFKDNPNQIVQIWMAVKFESTNIMKKNLMEMYKYLNKLNIPKILIITEFHLSEDQVEDKITLNEKFKMFKLQEIKYVGQDTDPTQFLSELEKSLPGCLRDTIFEEADQNFQQQLMDDFQRQFNKRS